MSRLWAVGQHFRLCVLRKQILAWVSKICLVLQAPNLEMFGWTRTSKLIRRFWNWKQFLQAYSGPFPALASTVIAKSKKKKKGLTSNKSSIVHICKYGSEIDRIQSSHINTRKTVRSPFSVDHSTYIYVRQCVCPMRDFTAKQNVVQGIRCNG